MSKRNVFLMYTRTNTAGLILMGVYKKTSYKKAFNQLAEIAERHGSRIQAGSGTIAVEVCSPSGQNWWLERHELL